MGQHQMTIRTALNNIQAYVTMLEHGKPTKTAHTRYLYAISQIQTIDNYAHFGHYKSLEKHEEKMKTYEEEHGKNETPRSEIDKAIRLSDSDQWIIGGEKWSNTLGKVVEE